MEEALSASASLYMAALTTSVSYWLFRFYFLKSIPFKLPDTSGRLSATLATIFILGFTRLLDTKHGVASFLSYMIADTLYSIVIGPRLDIFIIAHHFLCVFIAVAYFSVTSAGLSLEVVELVTRKLLFMEFSNPFLHISLTVNKEDRYEAWKAWVLPVTTPALLGSYFWFRVIQGSLCVPIVWQHRADFRPFGEVYFAVISGLAFLQLFWFVKICEGSMKVIFGRKKQL